MRNKSSQRHRLSRTSGAYNKWSTYEDVVFSAQFVKLGIQSVKQVCYLPWLQCLRYGCEGHDIAEEAVENPVNRCEFAIWLSASVVRVAMTYIVTQSLCSGSTVCPRCSVSAMCFGKMSKRDSWDDRLWVGSIMLAASASIRFNRVSNSSKLGRSSALSSKQSAINALTLSGMFRGTGGRFRTVLSAIRRITSVASWLSK